MRGLVLFALVLCILASPAHGSLLGDIGRAIGKIAKPIKKAIDTVTSHTMPCVPIPGHLCGPDDKKPVAWLLPDKFQCGTVQVSFADACRDHDNCYTTGKPQAECDDAMFADTVAECRRKLNGLAEQYCLQRARIYYEGVKLFGGMQHPGGGPADAAVSGSCAAEHTGVFSFCLGPGSDLYVVKFAGPKATELHMLSASSGYKSFARHTETGLHKTSLQDFTFGLLPGTNLLALKATSSALEAHALTRSSDFGAFNLHEVSGLHERTSNDKYSFLTAANGDVYAIKMHGTGTDSTEIHVLSAASNYKQFTKQTGTALHETTRHQFKFALGPNNDLFAIKTSATGSGHTEVHVLSASSNYQSFVLNVATGLHEVDGSWAFLVASNRDLLCIATGNTASQTTEVHILSASSNYAQFSLHSTSGLHPVAQPAPAANHDEL